MPFTCEIKSAKKLLNVYDGGIIKPYGFLSSRGTEPLESCLKMGIFRKDCFPKPALRDLVALK